MKVPALRFPEFQREGEWAIKPLGDIFEFHATANNSRADLSSSGEIFYLHYGDIHKQHNRYINFSKDVSTKISSALHRNATLLKNGDLIVTDASEDTEGIAKAVEVLGLTPERKAIAGLHTLLLRDSEKVFASGFRGLLFKIEGVKTQAKRLAVGTKVYSMSKTALRQIRLPTTSVAEQRKIADCLTSLDDLITAQAQKIETLKAHKKGLMQQLFPAESETVPSLRFPEFRKGSKWISSTLGEISRITSGGTPSRSEPGFWNGDIPWITTSLIDSNLINHAEEYITESGLRESSAKIFPKNTILMAMYGQGKTRGKVAMLGIEAATNQACAAIILNKKINTEFVFQNLAARYDEIRKMSNTGGQENLSAGLIEKIQIRYTKIEEEQQRIANCLSSIDDHITAQTQKLEALKTHKKGLMQGLFPALDGAAA